MFHPGLCRWSACSAHVTLRSARVRCAGQSSLRGWSPTVAKASSLSDWPSVMKADSKGWVNIFLAHCCFRHDYKLTGTRPSQATRDNIDGENHYLSTYCESNYQRRTHLLQSTMWNVLLRATHDNNRESQRWADTTAGKTRQALSTDIIPIVLTFLTWLKKHSATIRNFLASWPPKFLISACSRTASSVCTSTWLWNFWRRWWRSWIKSRSP